MEGLCDDRNEGRELCLAPRQTVDRRTRTHIVTIPGARARTTFSFTHTHTHAHTTHARTASLNTADAALARTQAHNVNPHTTRTYAINPTGTHQQLPHWPWFFTPVTAPKSRQSIDAAAAVGGSKIPSWTSPCSSSSGSAGERGCFIAKRSRRSRSVRSVKRVTPATYVRPGRALWASMVSTLSENTARRVWRSSALSYVTPWSRWNFSNRRSTREAEGTEGSAEAPAAKRQSSTWNRMSALCRPSLVCGTIECGLWLTIRPCDQIAQSKSTPDCRQLAYNVELLRP